MKGNVFSNANINQKGVIIFESEVKRKITYNCLRVNVSKNEINRGHRSKFNFVHDKDVRLLKFSLVWEKST